MPECEHVLPFFHQRAVCRPYICKYGIYGIITYPRQGKRTETTLFLTVWIKIDILQNLILQNAIWYVFCDI